MSSSRAGEAPEARQVHDHDATGRPGRIVLQHPEPGRKGSARLVPGVLGILEFEALYREGEAGKRWRRAGDPLERLVLVAEAAAGLPSPSRERGRPTDEKLADRIVRAAARLDPDELGLPPVAVITSERISPGGAPRVTDPRLAVCLLTRLSGRLFIARRTPHAPARERLAGTLIFVAMEVPDVRTATR